MNISLRTQLLAGGDLHRDRIALMNIRYILGAILFDVIIDDFRVEK